jgi:hypothetical protein
MFTPWQMQSGGAIYAGGNIEGHDVVCRSWLYVNGLPLSNNSGWFQFHNNVQVPVLQVGGLQCENSGGYFYFHNAINAHSIYCRGGIDTHDANVRNQVVGNRLYSHGNVEGHYFECRSHMTVGYAGIIYGWLHGGHQISFSYDGWLQMWVNGGHVGGVAICDERIKRDIHPSEVDALGLLNQIKLYAFHWVNPVDGTVAETETTCGLVAQQIEKIIPSAIQQPANPDSTPRKMLKSLDMAAYYGYTTRAIQQLSQRLAAAEARLKELRHAA